MFLPSFKSQYVQFHSVCFSAVTHSHRQLNTGVQLHHRGRLLLHQSTPHLLGQLVPLRMCVFVCKRPLLGNKFQTVRFDTSWLKSYFWKAFVSPIWFDCSHIQCLGNLLYIMVHPQDGNVSKGKHAWLLCACVCYILYVLYKVPPGGVGILHTQVSDLHLMKLNYSKNIFTPATYRKIRPLFKNFYLKRRHYLSVDCLLCKQVLLHHFGFTQ